ncbi:SCO family protein [Salicola sp. Rm-C-2C1-2]|uniref:SCO family protein n=1 Tax=Salicola sp. Rm-C-2C1-2 TaxID=3141321 RepID=UPI0032E49BBC
MLALPWLAGALTQRDHYGVGTAGPVPDLPQLSRDRMEQQSIAATFVFFGYQGCTASCPAQLVNMRKLANQLDRDDVRFLYITLAPADVTASDLRQWLHTLGPAFVGHHPEDADHARRLIQSFGGFSDRYNESMARFSHSADLYLVARNRQMLRYSGVALDLARVQQDLVAVTD